MISTTIGENKAGVLVTITENDSASISTTDNNNAAVDKDAIVEKGSFVADNPTVEEFPGIEWQATVEQSITEENSPVPTVKDTDYISHYIHSMFFMAVGAIVTAGIVAGYSKSILKWSALANVFVVRICYINSSSN